MCTLWTWSRPQSHGERSRDRAPLGGDVAEVSGRGDLAGQPAVAGRADRAAHGRSARVIEGRVAQKNTTCTWREKTPELRAKRPGACLARNLAMYSPRTHLVRP